MGEFVKNYLNKDQQLRILDVGSMNVLETGTYKQHFNNPNWEYVGCDLEAGPNVDVVLNDPYILPFENESFDVVISGQTFEHVEFFWLSAKEISRVTKSGGLFCIVVPSTGQVHRFPVDCWRFYEDGMRAIAKWMEYDVLEVEITEHSDWKDAVLIAKKR
jgi:SAM-dependent methyltransferase